MKQAISATPVTQASSLRDQTFILSVNGGTTRTVLTLTPTPAFRVERIGIGKFRVTIVDHTPLLPDGPLDAYKTIGWTVSTQFSGDEGFDIAVEGEASCLYQATFRRVGGASLDLSALSSAYAISWELSDSSVVKAVRVEGSGLSVLRVPNASRSSNIRLVLANQSSSQVVRSAWVAIPRCQVDTTVASETATPPPTLPEAQPERPARDLIELKLSGSGVCRTNCGGNAYTVLVTATNVGNRPIRCVQGNVTLTFGSDRYVSENRWLQLDPGQTHSFETTVRLPASAQPPYGVRLNQGNCWYL